jgi:glutamyl-tRNA synthetase
MAAFLAASAAASASAWLANGPSCPLSVLGLPAPEFYHMPLLLAVDGRRLSKRDGDESLEHLQARYTPEQIIGRLAYACGLQNAPDPRTPAELADGFSWQRVPQNDIILPEGLF